MARNLIHRGLVLARHLLAALGVAGLFSTSAAANPISSIERLALESRVRALRQSLQDSAPPSLPAEKSDLSSAQRPWGNWNNWGNWGNWNNWANAWNNWGNWGNWFNG